MSEPVNPIVEQGVSVDQAPAPAQTTPLKNPNAGFLRTIKVDEPGRMLRDIADAAPTEADGRSPGVSVDIGNGMLGLELAEPDQSFNLGNIFSSDASNLGNDRFTGVYIETKSGNRYFIGGDYMRGRVVNASQSRALGKPHAIEYNGETLARSKIIIGKPLTYGIGSQYTGTTSDVVRATFINGGRVYDQQYLDGLTGGKKSAAVEEFARDSQPDKESLQAKTEAASQPEVNLESIKRPLTVEDVIEFQRQFRNFDQASRAAGKAYLLNENQYYEFLSTGAFYGVEKPAGQEVDLLTAEGKQAYDSLLLSTFKNWRAALIADQARISKKRPELTKQLGDFRTIPDPQTAAEVRQLYINNPALNELSAAQYQDGLSGQFVENNFLHFQGHRASGYQYERPNTETRVYLNPPVNEAPKLAAEFVRIATERGIPYYFKLIDFSLQKPSPQDYQRVDKMLFYSDKANAAKIVGVLAEIRSQHPDWFGGRSLPPMVARVMDGVGVAEEPSPFQNQKFKVPGHENTSFNRVRAAYFDRLWPEVMREVLIRNPDIRPRGGRTMREIFTDFVPAESRDLVDNLWAKGLKADADDRPARMALDYALKYSVQDVLPDIKPESLLPWVQMVSRKISPDFGIDPNNIAGNSN
ncbi:MAG: hypothetical protein KBD51_01625 [Candidatus Levybacteria bacterium]|nr:hypothetical protein [Candidatus Levybacteria bacterium]